MSVIHILKDGTRVDSIAGLVVKPEDAEQVYRVIDAINKRLAKKGQPIHNKEAKHEHNHD